MFKYLVYLLKHMAYESIKTLFKMYYWFKLNICICIRFGV